MILYGPLDNSKIAWAYKTAQEKEIILKWEEKKSYIFKEATAKISFTNFRTVSQGEWVVAIQNTVVQSIELQGNSGGTSKNRQNSSGTGIAKLAGAAPLMTVQVTANTGVASVKGVPPAKVMSPWIGGTGIAQFACAAPFMTIQLTSINGQSQLKCCPQLK